MNPSPVTIPFSMLIVLTTFAYSKETALPGRFTLIECVNEFTSARVEST